MARSTARRRPKTPQAVEDPPPSDLAELGRRLADAAESLREIGLALAEGSSFSEAMAQPSDPVDALKVYLSDERMRIRLQDLIDAETGKVLQALGSEDLGMGEGFSAEEVNRRLERYGEVARPLAELLAVGGYWGSMGQVTQWCRAIKATANAVPGGNGLNVWLKLRLLPSTLLLYAAGVGAVAGGNLGAAVRVLREPTVREPIATHPAALALLPNEVLSSQVANSAIESLKRHYTPGSDYVHDWLRPLTTGLVPDDEDYSELFDKWEYLHGLAYLDLAGGDRWAPVGRIAWRRRYSEGVNFGADFLRDLGEQGREWAPLQAGMFGRDPEKAQAGLERYAEIASKARSTVF